MDWDKLQGADGFFDLLGICNAADRRGPLFSRPRIGFEQVLKPARLNLIKKAPSGADGAFSCASQEAETIKKSSEFRHLKIRFAHVPLGPHAMKKGVVFLHALYQNRRTDGFLNPWL